MLGWLFGFGANDTENQSNDSDYLADGWVGIWRCPAGQVSPQRKWKECRWEDAESIVERDKAATGGRYEYWVNGRWWG